MKAVCEHEWHITSSPARIPPLVGKVLDALSAGLSGLSYEERYDFRLMLNELLLNAVMHGNQLNESKSVHLHLLIENSQARVTITDEGVGFDALNTFSRASNTNEERLRQESGRGMTIVSALADYVEYSRDGRRVTFIKRVGV